MKRQDIDQLKKEYMEIPIPEELDFIVKKSLKDSRKLNNKRNSFVKKSTMVAASVILALTLGANTSATFAQTASKIPVIGNVVKVLTFREYKVDEENYKADIKIPSINGLDKNSTLENSLNEKYLAEGKELYQSFMEETDYLKKIGVGGHTGVKSGYEVKTDTDKILAVQRYAVSTTNGYSSVKYDTIDKEKQVLITLPSLFMDDSYSKIIYENVKSQMIERNKKDSSNYYWVEGVEKDSKMWSFSKISKDQNFYINADNKLVICFEKYEAAPGAMGNLEFVIPTDAIKEILVGNEYIK